MTVRGFMTVMIGIIAFVVVDAVVAYRLLEWSSLSIKEKAGRVIISPLVPPVLLLLKINTHFYHRQLVREGKEQRDSFSGVLW